MQPWAMGDGIEQDERWTIADLHEALPKLL